MDRTGDPPTVQTSQTAFDVVEFLMDSGGATVTEVARGVDVSKSTAYRHLHTLVDRGYLVKHDNVYDLSLRFLRIGEYVSSRDPGFELAKRMVDDLAAHTEEHAQFFVKEHWWAIYVYGTAGEHAVRSGPKLGSELHLHATAGGKAILAQLPRATVEAFVAEQGLPALTENTITDPEELFRELETIRERGYALNHEEDHDRLRAVGVSILDSNGESFGAISVSGPTRRMSGDRFREELPKHLLGRANELELNIELERSGPT